MGLLIVQPAPIYLCQRVKVIIHKLRSDVSLGEQDTIEYVS